MVWLRASGARPGLVWGRAGAFFDKCIVDWKVAAAGDALSYARDHAPGRTCPTMSDFEKCTFAQMEWRPEDANPAAKHVGHAAGSMSQGEDKGDIEGHPEYVTPSCRTPSNGASASRSFPRTPSRASACP